MYLRWKCEDYYSWHSQSVHRDAPKIARSIQEKQTKYDTQRVGSAQWRVITWSGCAVCLRSRSLVSRARAVSSAAAACVQRSGNATTSRVLISNAIGARSCVAWRQTHVRTWRHCREIEPEHSSRLKGPYSVWTTTDPRHCAFEVRCLTLVRV